MIATILLSVLAGVVVGWTLSAISRRESRGRVLTPRATPTGDPPVTRLIPLSGKFNSDVLCQRCGGRTRQVPHPAHGDSWYFECIQGHHTIIGK